MEQYVPLKTVKTFYSSVYESYAQKNGAGLTKAFRQLYILNQYQSLTSDNWKVDIKFSDYHRFDDQLTAIFVKILSLIKEYQINRKAKQFQGAFDVQMKLLHLILEYFKQIKEVNELWIVKPLKILVRATKRVFFQSIKNLTNSSKIKNDLINTLTNFKRSRALLEQIQRQVFPMIDNMQVSILFSIHNYEMIKMIIYSSRLLNDNTSKFRDNFLFLKGKYALVNENIKEAEESFQKIKIRTKGQKRLVLKYLIPCKIFLGKMFQPKENLPQQSFPEYKSLIQSFKKASFTQFDQTVQKYQKLWIKRGIYLLMDKLRIIIWRNLLKRIIQAIGPKISMDKIQTAVKLAGGQETMNQCICIIGNLIYQGYVKGSIFQNDQVKGLVVKATGAFPKLSAIAK